MALPARVALGALIVGTGLCVFWLVRRDVQEAGPRPPDRVQVVGCVRNGERPIGSARVRLKGTAIGTLTDDAGRFRLTTDRAGRVTAWADGFLIAGASSRQSPVDLALTPLPSTDNGDYAWVDPTPDPGDAGRCGNCHAATYREWRSSAHSRSATGLHFRNFYEGTDATGKANVGWGLLTQYPDGAGVCASCHAPALSDDDRATREDLRHVTGVAAQGVHCDYCHKIADVGDGTFGLAHGRFNLRLLRPPVGQDSNPAKQERPKQLFFGPLDDVDRGEDAFSPLYRESRYCASCHEGIVFGVHVYSTYSEWLSSPARRAGKQCQDCHMAPTGALTNIAPGHGGIERDPRTLGSHRFFAPDQGEMLRRCVNVRASLDRDGADRRATVRISAENVGHRVPTGFIDRHLILVVDALDADGKPVRALSGPTLPAAVGPDLSGRPGRLFAKLLTGRDGKAPAPFWLGGAEPADTRLMPGRVEEFAWRFPPDAARLRIRVLYRRFWDDVARTKKWCEIDTVVQDLTVSSR